MLTTLAIFEQLSWLKITTILFFENVDTWFVITTATLEPTINFRTRHRSNVPQNLYVLFFLHFSWNSYRTKGKTNWPPMSTYCNFLETLSQVGKVHSFIKMHFLKFLCSSPQYIWRPSSFFWTKLTNKLWNEN